MIDLILWSVLATGTLLVWIAVTLVAPGRRAPQRHLRLVVARPSKPGRGRASGERPRGALMPLRPRRRASASHLRCIAGGAEGSPKRATADVDATRTTARTGAHGVATEILKAPHGHG